MAGVIMGKCRWMTWYMFGRKEGYIVGCVDNPHYNRVYSLSDICPHCGKKVIVDNEREDGDSDEID